MGRGGQDAGADTLSPALRGAEDRDIEAQGVWHCAKVTQQASSRVGGPGPLAKLTTTIPAAGVLGRGLSRAAPHRCRACLRGEAPSASH